jgi:cytochrome P450
MVTAGTRCPVAFDEDLGMWVVSDPVIVSQVLLDAAAFPPDNALTAYTPLSVRSLRILADSGFRLPPSLASNSSPTHLPIRRTVARFLSPARVAAVEPLVRRLVEDRLAAVVAALDIEGEADLAALLAAEVPARALLQLLSVGDAPLDRLRTWSRHSLELFWGRTAGKRQQELARSAGEYYGWLREQVGRSRARPGDDLFSALVALGLDDDVVCATGYFLLIAGQETTSMLISTILWRLLGDPSAWRSAREPETVVRAVESALQEESSVPTWRRTARDSTELGQAQVPAGAELLLTLTGRGGDSDLAFGVGVHRCLGARLARMEARVVVAATAAALPNLCRVEDSPPRLRLLSFAAPERVLVRRPAAEAAALDRFG